MRRLHVTPHQVILIPHQIILIPLNLRCLTAHRSIAFFSQRGTLRPDNKSGAQDDASEVMESAMDASREGADASHGQEVHEGMRYFFEAPVILHYSAEMLMLGLRYFRKTASRVSFSLSIQQLVDRADRRSSHILVSLP